MPLTITVSLLKGGASKTTTALALAEAAALSVPVVLVDTDPMGSAWRWSYLAERSGRPLQCRVVPLPTADLARHLRTVTRDAAVVVIDSPPPGDLAVARAAVDAADTVVMPTTPNYADLDRVNATAEIAAGKSAGATLVQVRGGLEDAAAAAVALRSWGIRVYDSQLSLSVSVARNYGQPVTGMLLRYGVDLMTEITKEA